MPTVFRSGPYGLGAARATRALVSDDELTVELSDGRTLSVPIAWFPRLAHGTRRERSRWRLIGGGAGLHWPDLDEDVSVESLLAGRASGESQESFGRWKAARRARRGGRSGKS